MNAMQDCSVCPPSHNVPSPLNKVYVEPFDWINPDLHIFHRCGKAFAMVFTLLLRTVKPFTNCLLSKYGTKSTSIIFIENEVNLQSNFTSPTTGVMDGIRFWENDFSRYGEPRCTSSMEVF